MDYYSNDFLIKYAPRRLSELLGIENQSIVRRLIQVRGRKKALVGAFGEGKTAITHAVAMGVGCQSALSERPCGECFSCLSLFEKLHAGTSFWGSNADSEKIWVIDCTRLLAKDMDEITLTLTVLGNGPRLVIFDEFHDVNEDIQHKFLKLLEVKMQCTMLFSFASVNTNNLTKAVLQRLSPPLVPTLPTVEEFLPLFKRVTAAEQIAPVDRAAQDFLVNVCGRVPRLVLKALEDVKDVGAGLTMDVVESIASRLKIIGDGREKTK